MDITKEKTLEEMAATLTDTITVSSSNWYDPYYGAVLPQCADQTPTLNIQNLDSTFNGMNYSNTSIGVGGGGGVGQVWITGSTSPLWTSYTSPQTFNLNPTTQSVKIKLDGEGADIEVNGWSLIESIKKIEERLNILTPDTKLESEWEELRALGKQYRKLEQHILDKQATWDRLKTMPPLAVE